VGIGRGKPRYVTKLMTGLLSRTPYMQQKIKIQKSKNQNSKIKDHPSSKV
jgi:hypothetical protein